MRRRNDRAGDREFSDVRANDGRSCCNEILPHWIHGAVSGVERPSLLKFLGFPQFARALVQMRYSIGENGCGHILMGGNSGGKEGRDMGIRKGRRRKGEKGGGYL